MTFQFSEWNSLLGFYIVVVASQLFHRLYQRHAHIDQSNMLCSNSSLQHSVTPEGRVRKLGLLSKIGTFLGPNWDFDPKSRIRGLNGTPAQMLTNPKISCFQIMFLKYSPRRACCCHHSARVGQIGPFYHFSKGNEGNKCSVFRLLFTFWQKDPR